MAQYLNLLLLIDILVRVEDGAELCEDSTLYLDFLEHLIGQFNLFLSRNIILVQVSEKDDSVLVKLSLDLDEVFADHVQVLLLLCVYALKLFCCEELVNLHKIIFALHEPYLSGAISGPKGGFKAHSIREMSFGLDNKFLLLFSRLEVLEATPIDKTIKGLAANFQLSILIIEGDALSVVAGVKCIVDCISVEVFAVEDGIFKELLTLNELHFSLEHKAELDEVLVQGFSLCIRLEGLHEIVLLIVLDIGLLVHVVELEGALYSSKGFLVASRVMEHDS